MVPVKDYPRLVQHLQLKEDLADSYQPMGYTDIRRGGTFGVASLFRFEYMGRAEYEHGAIPTAREKLVDVLKTDWPSPVEIQEGGHSCWYIGPREGIQTARVFFATELADGNCPHTKEYTKLQRSYLNPHPHSPEGWWVLLPLPGFAIFKTLDGAKAFLLALQEFR